MTEPTAPIAPASPQSTELHGQAHTDDFAWLRDRESEQVLDYLRAENAYAEKLMAPTADLQETLYAEMRARLQENDRSVPTRVGDFSYYYRTEAGKQYSVYCRKAHKDGGEPGQEEILLDLNEEVGDGGFLSLGVYRVSPDHRLLAYSLDRDGSERYVLRVRDLQTGEDSAEQIPNTAGSAEWLNDSRTLIYSTRNSAQRPYRAFAHRVGEDPENDRLLFEESDERFFLSLSKTLSRRFVVLSLGTHTMTELHVWDADDGQSEFRLLAARRPGIELSVDHHGDRFFLRTNAEADDFRLLSIKTDQLQAQDWVEVLPERPQVVIEGLVCFRRHLVLEVRSSALKGLEIYRLGEREPDLASQDPTRVVFEEPVYTVHMTGNAVFESSTLRFAYSSFLTPRSVFDYDMVTADRVLLKQDDVGVHQPEGYVSERIFALAPDGTGVPISLVRRKDVRLDGEAPLLLYGYGSYGTSIEPRFSIARLSLLSRGVIYAIAHVRGGGAYGRSWYEDGKLGHKQNTFSDFEAAAETLIAKRYTKPRRLMIRGASAGGLLIGAVLNRRPDLFHAALAEVPFVDVLNTMLDPSIPLTVIEYDEWGNPGEDRQAWDWIQEYSPYDNVQSASYPHLLVTAGLYDPRVQYWEPAKWVARLRAARTGKDLLLLKTDMGSGHGGASGRYDSLVQEAFKYAFLLHALDTERNADLS